jgi:agmatine/peptidylarginine deiminase
MIAEVLNHASKYHLSRIYLSTSVLQTNAIAMYKGSGWVEVDREETWLRDCIPVILITLERDLTF